MEPSSSSIVQEQTAASNDTRRLWSVESAIQWGVRNGLDGQRLTELQEFATLIKTVEISASDLQGGTTLDSGSFGIIEKSTLKGLPVAVKRFIKDANGSKSLAQVLREAHLELSMLCSTKHPNIVEFLGVPAYFPVETDSDQTNSFGFVFEFCSNGSLFSIIHEKRIKFSFQEKIRLMKELAMSLVYLHSQEIIHRDISSRNVLLTGDLKLKLADFGCARKIAGASYQPTTISGNPPWMAPEQLGGLALSFSADVWSFGVVVWELVTETLPWNEVASDLWAMRKLVFDEGHHLPIPHLNPALPEIKDDARVVAVIIKLCFSRQPYARPSMVAILSSLQVVEERRSQEWIEELISSRRLELERRLALFFNQQIQSSQLLQSLSSNEETMLLARLHAEDLDENLINTYLLAKYRCDLSAIRGCAALSHVEAGKQHNRTSIAPNRLCRTCPHTCGEVITGYHEVVLSDESRYVGDVVNGQFHGSGIVIRDDGTKLQGEFKNGQLVRHFSMESMQVLRPIESSKGQNDGPGTDKPKESESARAVTEVADSNKVPSVETQPDDIHDCQIGTSGIEHAAGEPEINTKKERYKYLKAKLEMFSQLKDLNEEDSVDNLAEVYSKDDSDTQINCYLLQTYHLDLTSLKDRGLEQKKTSAVNKPKKSQTYTCRLCPHHHGQLLSGHHEVYLPDGSLYVGDMIDGLFEGLGILTRSDGCKLQGQFKSNQLVLPFSVEDVRSTLPPGGGDRELSDASTASQDVIIPDKVNHREIAANNGNGFGVVEHPVFELATDVEPDTRVADSPFVGNHSLPPKLVNKNLMHLGLSQHVTVPNDGSPISLRQHLIGANPGSQNNVGAINLDRNVNGGSNGLHLSAPSVSYVVDAPSDGTPVPVRHAPEFPRVGEVYRSGQAESQHMPNGNSTNILNYGGNGSDQNCGGTPGPQAPIANLFRISTPGLGVGAISNSHTEHLHVFESPNHVGSFWGAQAQDMQSMYHSAAHAYHANSFGYFDPNVQASSHGNVFPYSGAQHHLLPQKSHDEPGPGVKRFLEEQSPFHNNANYLLPSLLEPRIDSRQNVLHSISSNVLQNTPGSMAMSEKRRVMELQATQGQAFHSRQLLPHASNAVGIPVSASMSPYFDHGMR